MNRHTIRMPFNTVFHNVISAVALFLWVNLSKVKSEYVNGLSAHDRMYWRCREYTGSPFFITISVAYNAQNIEVDIRGGDESKDMVLRFAATLSRVFVFFSPTEQITNENITTYLLDDDSTVPTITQFPPSSPIPIPTASSSETLTRLQKFAKPTTFREVNERVSPPLPLNALTYILPTNFRLRSREKHPEAVRMVDAYLTEHVGKMYSAKLSDFDDYDGMPLYDSCQMIEEMSASYVSVWDLTLRTEETQQNLIRVYLYECNGFQLVEVRQVRGRHSQFYPFFDHFEFTLSGTGRLAPIPEKIAEEENL